jgi:hypothetical protein
MWYIEKNNISIVRFDGEPNPQLLAKTGKFLVKVVNRLCRWYEGLFVDFASDAADYERRKLKSK